MPEDPKKGQGKRQKARKPRKTTADTPKSKKSKQTGKSAKSKKKRDPKAPYGYKKDGTPKKKPGGPPKGNRNTTPDRFPELAERILHRMHTPTARSVFSVLQDKDIRLSEMKFWQWLRDDSNFAKKYLRARELQADRLVWEGKAVADLATDPGEEMMTFLRHFPDNLGSAVNAWMTAQRERVRVRQWMAGKLNPKKYGKNVETDAGLDEGQRMNLDEAERAMSDMEEEDAAKLYNEMLSGAKA